MPCDYSSIKDENERGMRPLIDRIGKMLLAKLYADRTHFIFELLQNAEDAMARRGGWQGNRAVHFGLSKHDLRVQHFGELFDEHNVRAICDILKTTKDLTDIGHFGIGFKSVYAFTDMPEVHSGEENFAIENYIWPTPAKPIDRHPDATVFLLPLRPQDATAFDDITEGLRKLGPQTLLFLRHIDEIAWSVEGGPSGLYLRSAPKTIGENVRQIIVIGQEQGRADIEETWLVFSRSAKTDGGPLTGQVEIAFSIAQDKESRQQSVQAVSDSPLVVFFPTVLSTHLGFLVQGPYRTTPSRDNVPANDPGNQHLVKETAALLVESLRSLRDLGLLDVGALKSLPLDRTRFGEGQMFAPLFDAARDALSSEPLLPRFGGGHASAKSVMLARTQELRELVSPAQLGALFGEGKESFWLSEDITQDRTPDLRQYLMRELDIAEITPETLLPGLNKTFLEAQPDEWIGRLYEFLNGQPSLQRRLDDLPLIRLADGTHVPARSNGQPRAFLPSAIETAFPTVRRTVCASDEARKFLQSLGLTEPDPVDDVVWNVLPRYSADEVDVDDEDYEADIRRILTAFATDSKVQREKLLAALRESSFVMAADAGDGSKWVSKPGDIYLATERLKELFAGVGKVLLVDDSYACLRGEDIRDLLEACGATRYLQPIRVEPNFTWEQSREMRRVAGCENSSRGETIDDYSLRGLDALLDALPTLAASTAAKKAALLWEALADVEDRRSTRAFSGTYRWFYVNPQSCDFDAAFVRRLNETAWIPDANSDLQRSEFVIFDTLGWEPNPFLLSKIKFKPPTIEALAREAGIEPGVLVLLKKLGVTSEAELKARLGIIEDKAPETGEKEPVGAPEQKRIREQTPSVEKGERKIPGSEGGKEAREAKDQQEHSQPEEESFDLVDAETTDYRVVTGPPATTGDGGGGGGGETSQASLVLSQEQKTAIEKCGRTIARREVEDTQYEVEEMPLDNPGFDLRATKAQSRELRIEVKAHLGGASVIDLTRREYQEYLGRESGGYDWQLWNIEHLRKDAGSSPTVAKFRTIPDKALDARIFRVNLRECSAEG